MLCLVAFRVFGENVNAMNTNNWTEMKLVVRAELAKFENNDLVIWGSGFFGEYIYSLLSSLELNINIVCFCNSFQQDDLDVYLRGKPILSSKKATELFPNAVYFIASQSYRDILLYIESNYPNLKLFCPERANSYQAIKRYMLFQMSEEYKGQH